MTNGELLHLRRTLQTLKDADAFSGHIKLAYAADKTLKEVNSQLETYDEMRDELLETYAERTGEDEIVYQAVEGKRVVRVTKDEEERVFRHADSGDTYGPFQEVAQTHDLGYAIDDREALEEDIQELREEEINGVDLHKVDLEIFQEHCHLDGVHSQVDLTALDPMLKEGSE